MWEGTADEKLTVDTATGHMYACKIVLDYGLVRYGIVLTVNSILQYACELSPVWSYKFYLI